jgi:hypothetical protein
MEREVSTFVKISVTMILLAALITIVMVTVDIGLSVGDSASEEGTRINNSIMSSELKSLAYIEDLVLPKAAAYNLLAQENKYVSKLIYTGDEGTSTITYGENSWVSKGVTNKSYNFLQDVLAEDLTGKVKLYVENNTDGTYTVTVTKVK